MLTPPSAIEALLFASGKPMKNAELARVLAIHEEDVKTALKELAKQLQSRGLTIVVSGDEVELRTSPEASEIVKKLREGELSRDLGKAGLETLAVIAYRTGATRSEIDWVRGVNSSTSVRTLLLRGLIEGEEDPNDKRKIRYRLTTEALAHLGLSTREDLPRFSELGPQASAVIDQAA